MDAPLPRRLVTIHLRPMAHEDRCLQLLGSAAALAAEAVALSGHGLDLYSGERVLAAMSVVAPRGRIAAAITNHRTIVGGDGRGFAVRHDEILGVTSAPGRLELRTPAGMRDLSALLPTSDALAAFYRDLAAVDPSRRVEPPCPTFAPDGTDPTGARGAIRDLWGNDPSAASMLSEVARRARCGDLDPDAAQDLVGRVVLSHRACASGPASFGASWLSPLQAADFGELALAVLGTPSTRRKPSAGVERLDFVVDGTLVGVSFREVSGGTCYTLHAGAQRLEATHGSLALLLHRRLVEGAHRWLERLCTAAQPLANAG